MMAACRRPDHRRRAVRRRARSAACTSPTSAPRSSRSRTRASAATSAATSRRTQDGEDTLFFETFNRNKRSLAPRPHDPERPRGLRGSRARQPTSSTRTCAATCRRSCGIRYDDLKHLNPRDRLLLAERLRHDRPARAPSRATTTSCRGSPGWMELTGEPDGPPTKSGLSLVDFSGGLVAALSLLAGVHAARRDGVGMDCDVSLFDTASSMLTYPATWHLNARLRAGAHPPLRASVARAVPELRDRRRLDRRRLRRRRSSGAADVASGAPSWPDPRFATFAARRANSAELLAIQEARSSRDAAMARPAGRPVVPCGPVNTVEEALAEPQTAARGPRGRRPSTPVFGTVRQLRSRSTSEPQPTYRRAPARHEDAEDLLVRILGYDASPSSSG